MSNPVDIAAKRMGGLSALAKAVGISPPSVSRWRKRAAVPASRALVVSSLTGLEPALLCPNVFSCMTPYPPECGEQEISEHASLSAKKIASGQHSDSSCQPGSHAEPFRKSRKTTISPASYPEKHIQCCRQQDVSDPVRFVAEGKDHD